MPALVGQALSPANAVSLLLGCLVAENGNPFDLYQQLRPAKNRLDPRGRRQRIQILLSIESRPLLVEGFVVALDIPQVTGGAHYVFPGGALGFQQGRDVVEGATELRAEIADVQRFPVGADGGGSRDQQND